MSDRVHNSRPNKLSQIWQNLVRPHPRLTEQETREHGRLLSGMFLVTSVVLVLILVMVGLLDGRDLLNPAAITGYLILSACITLYFVNRAGYFKFALWIFTVLITISLVIVPYVEGASFGLAPFTIVPIILVGIFYGSKAMYIITAIILMTTFVFNQLNYSNQYFWGLQVDWYFQIFASGLIVVFVRHMHRLEDIRREELEITNQQLRESEELLEKRVDERTSELQLAYQKVEALNRVKDEFVSNVSHELRTPITSMKLQNYLLKQNALPQQQAHIDILEREITRHNTLIESLLTLSRLDQKRIELQIKPLNLNQMVASYILDRKALAQDKQLELKADLCPDNLWVNADPHLMEQVLSILLTNAMNYTPSGGAITVQTEAIIYNESEGWGKLMVQDTGIGIPPNEQVELFDRFFRGISARETKVEGTGLGLSIAKEIVDQHEGTITVESSGIPGQGTIFYVQIPMAVHANHA